MSALRKVEIYNLFWYSIPVFVILLALLPRGAVDIQLHDTYFVLGLWFLIRVFTLVLVLIGLVYWWLGKYNLLASLSWFHAICSIVPIVLVLSIMVFFKIDYFHLDHLNFRAIIILACIFLFLIAQLAFIFNLVLALITGKHKDPK